MSRSYKDARPEALVATISKPKNILKPVFKCYPIYNLYYIVGKMELQRFRLLCIFVFVTILVVHGPSTTYADEFEPSPSIILGPILAPIPTPPFGPSPIAPPTPAPTPSEDED